MKNKTLLSILILIILKHNLLFGQIKTEYFETNTDRVYYEVCGTGAPIIFLSGGPGAPPQSMSPMIEYASKQYKTILLHQRGTGMSKNHTIDSTTITLNNYLEDILNVINKEKIKKTFLIGHSWGAILASDFMVKYPEKLKGVILIGAPGFSLDFLPIMNNTIMERLSKEEIDSIQQYSNQLNDSSIDTLTKEELLKKMIRITNSKQFFNPTLVDDLLSLGALNMDINILMIKHLVQSNWNIENDIRQISIPVVIINGKTDPIGVNIPTKMQQTIKNSQLYLVDKCGHYVWMEKPHELKEIIMNFLFQYKN
ncbi:MAG: alpha/beta hydrolase [Bacteroidia bacterium]|nr:alpha/beta hydrolase [Bacteroidia bacterium]